LSTKIGIPTLPTIVDGGKGKLHAKNNKIELKLFARRAYCKRPALSFESEKVKIFAEEMIRIPPF